MKIRSDLRAAGLGLLAVMSITGCSNVPGTGRPQLMLVSESQETKLGQEAYQQVLAEETVNNDPRMNAILTRVGRRIAEQADRPDFQWEFKLIESDQVNAFCLPGGKIAVYTGILPVMQNEAGMAIVIGHEVGHAVARHGAERMSQQMSMQMITAAAAEGLAHSSVPYQQGVMQAFGVGTQVGVMLPYSRAHELEADELGLSYAARAGYDPQEAVAVWERMQSAGSGSGPEFLSTHPHTQKRIDKFKKLMPEAEEEYEAAPQKHGKGETF